MIPTKLFITKGVGVHKEDKNARDAASREANIGNLNLLTVSSILPPGIRRIDVDEFKSTVRQGEIVHAINGVCQANEPGQRVTAAMAFVFPWDKTKTGYVTEIFEKVGIEPDVIVERVETMALQIFADENGVADFDASEVWERGRKTYDVGGNKVNVENVVATGVCNMQGEYTCALVAAALLP